MQTEREAAKIAALGIRVSWKRIKEAEMVWRGRRTLELLEAKRLLAADLSGQVFADLDNDGIFQAEQGEYGLDDFRVYLDVDGNGQLDQNQLEEEKSGVPIPLSETGARQVTLDVDAPGQTVLDLNVSLSIDNFFLDSLTVELRSPGGQFVRLFSTPDTEPTDILLDDEAAAEFLQGRGVTGPMRPMNPLSFFDGQSADGRWTLTVRQTDGFRAPELLQWSLLMTTTAEPVATTNTSGEFDLPDVPAGSYAVIAESPQEWQAPNAIGRVDVVLQDSNATNVPIPVTVPPLTLSGRIWNDSNANRLVDTDETGLAGWTVYLDENSNDVLDEGELYVLTSNDNPETPEVDEAGQYAFTDVADADHLVRVVTPEGWRSYAIATRETESTTYGVHSGRKWVSLRAGDRFTSITDLSGFGIGAIDYVENDRLMYGVQFDSLVTIDVASGELTTIGRFEDENQTYLPTGIAGLPNGQLFAISRDGFLAVDPSTGRVQKLAENADGISIIDFDYAGRLYGMHPVSGEGQVISELSTDTAIPQRTVMKGIFNAMDISPAGEILVSQFRSTSRYSLTGELLTNRTVDASLDAIGSIPAPNWNDISVNFESIPTQIDFGAYQPRSISGKLSLDDVDVQVGIEDVRIYLDTNDNGRFDIGERSVHTKQDDLKTESENEQGQFIFEDLPPGEYRVRQELPATMDTTASSITVVVSDGEDLTDVNFVNVLGATFSGYVYLDANGDSVNNDQEARLDNVTVYLDLDNNGQLDEREPFQVTSADGSFTFGPITSKDYTLRQIVPAGWLQTQPPPGAGGYSVSFPRDPADPFVFGQVRGGVIAGQVYYDANGDGRRSPFDRPIQDATVYLDTNKNGQLDLDEPHTVSGPDGYQFTTLAAGNYEVRVETVAGFRASTSINVGTSVALNQDILDVDFGMDPLPGAISGFRWLDDNANGQRELGEPGLPGLTVYLDLNENGRLDDHEPQTTTREDDVATTEDESGAYLFEALSPGRYHVREVPAARSQQTFPATPSLADRIFVVNRTNSEIEEYDGNGNRLNGFPIPDEIQSRSEHFLVAGATSLFYVQTRQSESILWELDPNQGNVLDSDPFDLATVNGMTFVDGKVVFLQNTNRLIRWDPVDDSFVTEFSEQRFFGDGLAALADPDYLLHADSDDIEVFSVDGSREVVRLNPDTAFRKIESLSANGDTIWARIDSDIYNYDRLGLTLNQFNLNSDDANDSFSGLTVGPRLPQSPNYHAIQLQAGQLASGLDFGNQQEPRYLAVGGIWQDSIENDVRDSGEAGAPDTQIRFEPLLFGGPTIDLATSIDSPLTPNRDEAGSVSANLLAGSYRVSAIENGHYLPLTDPFESLATAGQVYQLVTSEVGELTIRRQDLAQKHIEEIPLPDSPLFAGPQAIALSSQHLIYVDGSDGELARIWWMDTQQQVWNGPTTVDLNVYSVSAAVVVEEMLVLGGDGDAFALVDYLGNEPVRHIEIEMDFVSGLAFDPEGNTLLMSGSQLGQPMLASGDLAHGFEYRNIAGAVTGDIAVVNGSLLAVAKSTNQLIRYDSTTLQPVSKLDWADTHSVLGLVSPTPWRDSFYLQVTAAPTIQRFEFGIRPGSSAIPGDVNEDGVVNKADADDIHQSILQNLPYEVRRDQNQDGGVDSKDIDVVAQAMNALAGDANLDGDVNFADFLVLSENFGRAVECAWLDGDMDGDGTVQFSDFLLLSENFGKSGNGPSL